MNTITKQLNQQQVNQFHQCYKEYQSPSNNQYVLYFYRLENCSVTIYTNYKTVFQGKDASIYAGFLNEEKEFITHAGSDEVGTGDFFGPIVVVAAIVDQKAHDILQQYQIQDSKQLSDEYILKIVPEFIHEMLYSVLILNNDTYNRSIKSNNMNQIKAKLHNQAYLNLQKKYKKLPKLNYVDQFCEPNLYFNRYLHDTVDVFKNLIFETKAESKYLAVALASIIARYVFLQEFIKMNQHYNFQFPKGAGKQVDFAALEFKKMHSLEEMHHVAKLNFKNYQKLL